ncbi:potassium-transporting ATPase subunit KdpC [Leptospira sanjuanensis]|uniref:potassium-transporting ATPase subunit KdpC n=1 Tax=Leptospira sanjuanensis TaxID=2879643 RepID=UPI001EE78681|nr:potassium-transporting ATPase subunit KdpC [Leptospira sanjuanensis]MCG6166924.1 potassium-transporting ATPase subunit KdpC [Leptospira sanjuanensis]
MLQTSLIALRTLLVLTFITGVFYPIVVTGFGEKLFPFNANGSLLYRDDKLVGSELIGQKFTKQEYYWSRPSAVDYGTVSSGASNLSATSASLKKSVEERRASLLKEHPDQKVVPPDLLFSSGSGLDPHISPKAARFQTNRVANARKLNAQQLSRLNEILASSIEKPSLSYIGEERINVLRLNLKLDQEFGRIKE